uniref:Secreted protein n=1 Tax=Ascaris lumbricoides TaxID=6252 RepID=A0A0M3ILB5_ASCLU
MEWCGWLLGVSVTSLWVLGARCGAEETSGAIRAHTLELIGAALVGWRGDGVLMCVAVQEKAAEWEMGSSHNAAAAHRSRAAALLDARPDCPAPLLAATPALSSTMSTVLLMVTSQQPAPPPPRMLLLVLLLDTAPSSHTMLTLAKPPIR